MNWSFPLARRKQPVMGWRLSTIMLWVLLAGCQPIVAPTPVAPDQTMVGRSSASAEAVTVAFVRGGGLYMQTGSAAPRLIEDCTATDCRTHYLKWSPDGAYLLYYWGPAQEPYGESPAEIRLADHQGRVQTVAKGMGFNRPPTWSPDGRHLAYLVLTDRSPLGSAIRIMEVWTADVSPGGSVHNHQRRGEIGINVGCGGGGWSESADTYEREGGILYLGFLAAILEWTADDLLLFSNSCFAGGVGRFHLGLGRELAPYEGGLHSLSLNAAKDRWVAIDEKQRLVLGVPASLVYTPVAIQAPPALVFFGQATGDLYYTTIEEIRRTELEDAAARLRLEVNVHPYFEFTQPGLRMIKLPAMTEAVLWEGDGYAYARITQGADGTLFFARVEDNRELYAAIKQGKLTAANLPELLPQVDVLWLPPGQSTPTVWLANAAQFALAPASARNATR